MNKENVVQLKSYLNPPAGVKDVLHATVLLLGYPREEAKEWRYVKRILVAAGDDAIYNKWNTVNAQTIPPENIQLAEDLLAPYSVEQIRNISQPAAGFFLECKSKIEEEKSSGGAMQEHSK